MTGTASPAAAPRAWREAHAHLPSLGRSLCLPSLRDVRSRSDALRIIREAHAAHQAAPAGPDGWTIVLHARPLGWDDPRWPTRAELDRIAPATPCVVWSFDHHALAANTTALTLAEISRTTRDPEGGVICRDAHGEPDGLLLESAAHMVWKRAPEPRPSEYLDHVRAALAHLAALGCTEVHDLLSPLWLGPALAELHDRGELGMRVGLFAPYAELDAHLASAPGWQRPGLSLLGAKLFADGTLNSKTAWMLHDFADAPADRRRGTPLLTTDQIASALRTCEDRSIGLAVHAIGDGAVRACLDAAELAGSARHAHPFRIEHAEVIDEADVPRFKALGAVASVQPCHLLADVEALERSLPHRLHRVLPLRDLLDAGLVPGRTLIFGSDVPIVPADPADSITAATLRCRPHDPPSRAIAPHQAISEKTAWECFR